MLGQSIKFNFVRAGGILAFSAIFVLGSAGCDLFGSGGSSDDGGNDTATVSDAVKAELVATIFSAGVQSISGVVGNQAVAPGLRSAIRTPSGPAPMTAIDGCAGTTSWDTSAEDGDGYSVSVTGASCGSTASLDLVSCSNETETYHLEAGWTLDEGSLNMEFNDLASAESSVTRMAFGFTISGSVTGGALSEAIEASCTVAVDFNAEEYAGLASSFDPFDCSTSTISCTIGAESLGCEEVKSLLNNSLPASCWGR